MTIVYSHALFQDHDTGQHPESPARLAAVTRLLHDGNALARCADGGAADASVAALAAVHAPEQIAAAQLLCAQGGGYLDPDTVCSAASYAVARQAAGTAIAAVTSVVRGLHTSALCLVRPPGHHATARQSMGFCLFNNVAVAAQYAQQQLGVGRILVVDWDVHHGNGTQDIFYDSDAVVFYSIHRYPFYPGTGDAAETGTGRGLGATLNVPLAFGTSRAAYMQAFARGLERAARAARPDLILLSAGFDAHADDPVGNLGLATEDYAVMTAMVCETARTYCQGRIVSCLEGGYNLGALAASVATHLAALEAGDVAAGRG